MWTHLLFLGVGAIYHLWLNKSYTTAAIGVVVVVGGGVSVAVAAAFFYQRWNFSDAIET